MDQEYDKCANGLTPQCPHYENPIMQKLMGKPKSGAGFPSFNSDDLMAVNSLCNDCDSFTPFEN